MNILVISGSPRDNASSLNVAHYAQNQLNDKQGVASQIFDLNTCSLEFLSGKGPVDEQAKEMINNAHGYVFAVPEWHGMVPPAFKNLFQYFNGLFSHKPAYIIGVSSGTGGRYPIIELRSTTYKNSFINYIPISTVLDHVDETINAKGEYIAETDHMALRLDDGLRFLTTYTQALSAVRESDIYKEKRFKNGL
jgi:NAD(P)H-dependent FMN reductase